MIAAPLTDSVRCRARGDADYPRATWRAEAH